MRSSGSRAARDPALSPSRGEMGRQWQDQGVVGQIGLEGGAQVREDGAPGQLVDLSEGVGRRCRRLELAEVESRNPLLSPVSSIYPPHSTL